MATIEPKRTDILYHTGKALSSGLTDNCHHAILAQCRGGVAQLGERDNRTVEVRSSSLLTSTTTTQGRLEWPHGAVAQLGERNTGSVEVRSSILLSSTKSRTLAVRQAFFFSNKERRTTFANALFFVGRTQVRSSVPQRRVFACGSMVRSDRFVCGVSALRAETLHTIEHGVPLCRRLAGPTA